MHTIPEGFRSGGRAYGGAVVLRVSRTGWVWAFRAPRQGLEPAPDCLCVPQRTGELAQLWAARVARELGWRAWVRRARRCPGVEWECKVALPPGLSARAARERLPPLYSWLAELGV